MENQNAMKLMEKAMEIQSLKHQVEMLNLKSENVGGGLKVNEGESEFVTNKLFEREMESMKKENQLLQSKFEELETKLDQKTPAMTNIIKMIKQDIMTVYEKLEWGAEKFIKGKVMYFNLYTSYGEWFKDIFNVGKEREK